MRTFVALGGVQLETNVFDADVLRAAQREPGEYKNLVVRVWGFSAYFVDLNPIYQEELIARTTHII